jgi:hypothetical protein
MMQASAQEIGQSRTMVDLRCVGVPARLPAYSLSVGTSQTGGVVRTASGQQTALTPVNIEAPGL